MSFTTLISTADLAAKLMSPNWVIVDCRFNLADTAQGRRSYEEAHIPGAVYAHLDNDLSGPVLPGRTSRHPLPEAEIFAHTLSNWGIANDSQVIVYDAGGGATAARLWWMLRWVGHEAVALLDGGWARWQAEGRPAVSGLESNPPRIFKPHVRPELVLTVEEVEQIRTDPAYRLLDARSADRFRGQNETLDPVAGHIPGAVSFPFADNLEAGQTFLGVEALKARLAAVLGDTPAERTVFYCGSGVTAAHNVLAMLHAGLGEAKMYPGSWSEWITDPSRPVATSES
jgi:thiosulfate/3-mercaptopyruvate sulfurtransferase